MANLTELYLFDNKIEDAGMAALSTALGNGAMANLTKLSLYDNEIGDEGMKAFAAAVGSGALPALKKLYFDRDKISDRLLGHFIKEICKTRGISGSADLL